MSVALKLSTMTNPIFERLVVDHISAGIRDTVSQLGNFQMQFKPHFFSKNWQAPAPAQISVVMNLKQGEQPIQVRLHFDSKPVVDILENMLGDKVDPTSPDVLDGIGEISNMIYGLIKTKASGSGFSFGMSRPEANFTKDLPSNTHLNHQCLVLPFTINNSECFFEFIAFE